jgi:hypothetical protein
VPVSVFVFMQGEVSRISSPLLRPILNQFDHRRFYGSKNP